MTTIPRRRDGFTLVELLIVIVILGILATVTVFAVRGIKDDASGAACVADKRTMVAAVETYQAARATRPLPSIPTEAQLVSGGFLRTQSEYYDVDSSGNVVPSPSNAAGCS